MSVSADGVLSPASKLMDKAIEIAIEERSPFPEHAGFVDADTPHTEESMRWVAEKGASVILVWPDMTSQVIEPEEIIGERPPPFVPDY
jgi:hypothetical protein